jgi:hypothetical protein
MKLDEIAELLTKEEEPIGPIDKLKLITRRKLAG